VSTLLVASSGGHLKELHHLKDRVEGIEPPYSWVTFDTPQARSLLAGEEVDWVPFVGGRDPVNVARNLAHARRIFKRRRPEVVLSTGSAARIDGPSLSGKIMTRIPGVNLYTQYKAWAGDRWRYRGSVFDTFAGEEGPEGPPERLDKVVVTLGTYRGYDFSRLVERLLQVLPPETEVLWQTGDTDVTRFGIKGHDAIPEADLSQAMQEADAVVAHAGVGTALAAFEVGVCPLLIPRRYALKEHVDDHQIQIADELVKRDLALSIDASKMQVETLLAAGALRVVRPAQAPTFATVR
jgi:UDP-N-acetylglucosamine transferase subunit ALG13